MRASGMSGLVIACLANLMAVAAPVDFTVKVNGPDGPLMNFPLAVHQKGKDPLSAATNQEGVAHFSLESTLSGEIRVSAKLPPSSRGQSISESSALIQQFKARCQTLALPQYWEFSVPLNQGPLSRSISIERGVKLTVKPVALSLAADPSHCIHVPGVLMAMENLDKATGTVSRFGVPVNTASIGFLEFFEDEKPSRAVAFAIPASMTDINVGSLSIPSLTMNAKVRVRQLWTRMTDTRPVVYRGAALRLGGVTLVSTDGLTILSDTLGPEDPTHREGTEHMRTVVPAGTFYVLPGLFGATPEQVVVISRLRAGQDLSNRGLPMLTIAAGEEKTIEVNNVDMLNAIHAIEDGK